MTSAFPSAPAAHGIGHNNGPAMTGTGFRTHCWRIARENLLPTLPIEVVRLQVRRAKELGLPYRTYAGVRATTGRDLVAFLFSSNALGLFRHGQTLADGQGAHIAALMAQPHLGTAPGLSAETLARRLKGDHAIRFVSARSLPAFGASWSEMRGDMIGWLRASRLHPAEVLMIGETAHEAEMAGAGRLAGFLTGQSYFAERPTA